MKQKRSNKKYFKQDIWRNFLLKKPYFFHLWYCQCCNQNQKSELYQKVSPFYWKLCKLHILCWDIIVSLSDRLLATQSILPRVLLSKILWSFRETNTERDKHFSRLNDFIKKPLKLAKYSVSLSKQKTPYCQLINLGFTIKQPCVAFSNPLRGK